MNKEIEELVKNELVKFFMEEGYQRTEDVILQAMDRKELNRRVKLMEKENEAQRRREYERVRKLNQTFNEITEGIK